MKLVTITNVKNWVRCFSLPVQNSGIQNIDIVTSSSSNSSQPTLILDQIIFKIMHYIWKLIFDYIDLKKITHGYGKSRCLQQGFPSDTQSICLHLSKIILKTVSKLTLAHFFNVWWPCLGLITQISLNGLLLYTTLIAMTVNDQLFGTR